MSRETQRDLPSDVSIDFFRNVISTHSEVRSLRCLSDQVYEVVRTDGTVITVYLTDLYTVGITDYFDIRMRHPNVSCIVVASNWNSYTADAREQAKADKVGLFMVVEFMGALRRADFWNYAKPKTTDQAKPGTGQSA